jgi:hypothetical protein
MARSKATKQSPDNMRLLRREIRSPRKDILVYLHRLYVLGKVNEFLSHFRADAILGFFRPSADVG